jgi:ABC-type sugar transport system permease subunit/ABC-type glycerol-3-phosphate transport system substrate-binding protein
VRTAHSFALRVTFVAMAVALAACGSNDTTDSRRRLVVWGTTEGEAKVGYDSLIAHFERANPDIYVVRAIPERGQDLQKLLCSYVGGDPPDVIMRESRFLGNLAARGIVRPLDDLIARDRDDPDGIRREDFYPGCWDEMVYDGKVYAAPGYTSPSVFAYNRHIFREVGLDPDRPPRTWDELKEYIKKLVKFDEDGNLVRVGFIPHFRGMDLLDFYVAQLGGSVIDSTGRNATFNSPEVLRALEFNKELFDLQGGRTLVQAFAMATTQAENVDAFQLGKIAMALDDDFIIYRTARYGDPDRLDLGLDIAPQPELTDHPVLYQRGSIWAIPTGSDNVDAAWEFIKYLQSKEGYYLFRSTIARQDMEQKGMMYGGLHSRRPLNDVLQHFLPPQPALKEEAGKVIGMMEHVWSPKPNAVASYLWDRQEEAYDNATYGIMSPEEALAITNTKMQDELDRYYGQRRGTLVNWTNVAYVIFALLCVGLGVFWWFARKDTGVSGIGSREFWIGMAFLSPWIVGFLVFTAGPIVFSIIISFTEFELISPARWIGFEHYRFLLTSDPTFWKSLWNTLFMALGIPVGMVVGLSIAMLLNANVKGLSVYRTIYYLPAIVPIVASSILWIYVLHPKLGFLNMFLQDSGIAFVVGWMIEGLNVVRGWFGGRPVDPQFWLWLQSEDWSKPGIILMGLWGAGASMIIWLAGLKGIPQHLYEAAEIDGAGPWRRFTNVTLPMLTPYIFFNMVTGVIGTFQVFTQAFVMTNGGPAQSTLFYVYYLFNNAFSYFKMGYASAMAWLLFLMILALTAFQLWGAKRWVHYE